MDFELPAEIRILKNTLRRFVDQELIPIEMQSMDGPDLKPDIRKKLEAKTRELGLWLLEVPAELGGQDLSLLGIAVINEELARTVALPARGPGIFGPEVRSILLSLSDEQKKRYLGPVLKGEKSTAFAQTEPDAGADPGGMRTTAVRDGDHYRINGYKRFIAHAKGADFLQLVAATDPKKGSRGGLTVFLVDMNSPGVSIAGKTVHMMGDVTYEIALDDVRVPVENRIGQEGDGMKTAQKWINANRVNQAARGVGVAQRCLEMITSYAAQRSTFGRPLQSRQAVQFAVADLYTKLQAGQLLTYRTAWKFDNGSLQRHETFMTKVFCTELGYEAADRCMQFHGGLGTATEMPIERMWRQSRSFMITGGPVEIMRASLAREVFALYA
ncbi:MAG: acyl-CoA dehydrogenase [Alphaproteobacteria bacterium]|jgi:acyl-CoA dehydrogenase|nr:acyl-CoA dehydrogenase [Alphaproteobacteria bacterium]